MNYAKLYKFDIANGIGWRVSLFVQGCCIRCPACFNKSTWDPEGGKPFTNEVKAKIFNELSKDVVEGLSILGGEPLAPYNCESVISLCKEVRKRFPDKTIWLWSGYEFEVIQADPTKSEVLQYLDKIIVGPFIEELKDTTLLWRGSSNQRILNLTNGSLRNILTAE